MPTERIWLIATAAIVPATVAFIAYRLLDFVVERLLPERLGRRLAPVVFVGPAVVLVFVGLVIPALITIWISFQRNRTGEWAGLDNYERVLSNPAMVDVLINTALWTLVVPVVTVVFGLLIAVVADRLPGPLENLVKSIMFFPMAVSLVAAAVLWRFVYAYRPDDPQIGVANAVVTALGGEPVAWIIDFNYRLNTFALMVTGIWTTTGFAMVLLAAAIKNVPIETIEAARVDGAGGWSIFRRIVAPQIKGTILVVLTTIALLMLKVFDIVYTNTAGLFKTDVVGNQFFLSLFRYNDPGAASVLVVLLLILVFPFMLLNIRRFVESGSG